MYRADNGRQIAHNLSIARIVELTGKAVASLDSEAEINLFEEWLTGSMDHYDEWLMYDPEVIEQMYQLILYNLVRCLFRTPSVVFHA